MQTKLRTGYSQTEKREVRRRLRKCNMHRRVYFQWLAGFSVFNLYWGN